MADAFDPAVKAFPDAKQKHHVIIILSDGEDFEGSVDQAIKTAKEANARIYTIGLGSKEGEPIPLKDTYGKISGYKKDKHGQVVITKLNETLLKQIAEETGGIYFEAAPGEKEVEWIYQHMKNIDRKDFKQRQVTEKEDHYQFFLGLALILFMLETMIGERKSNAN